jgi:hypothetical protein
MSPLLPDEQRQGQIGTVGAAVALEPERDAEARFQSLAAEWKAGRGHTSSISKMCTHPAYQQVIGMGHRAIPLILRELERAPDHWFWALKAIAGVNPVPREERADIRAMAKHWIEWGRKEGYRW